MYTYKKRQNHCTLRQNGAKSCHPNFGCYFQNSCSKIIHKIPKHLIKHDNKFKAKIILNRTHPQHGTIKFYKKLVLNCCMSKATKRCFTKL